MQRNKVLMSCPFNLKFEKSQLETIHKYMANSLVKWV